MILVLSALVLGLAQGAPMFNVDEVNGFEKQLKQLKFVDDQALTVLFDFYRGNRKTTGALQDRSCVEKPEYRLRFHDKGLKIKDLSQGIQNESCLCVMDYTKSKFEPRGHCIFLEKNKKPQVEHFLVSHGKGSKEVSGVPQLFTNKVTPTGTTLSGLFLTGPKMFRFHSLGGTAYGKYSSDGLALYGVEATNWTASRVGKVTHGAPYVKPAQIKEGKPIKAEVGASKGCPAMEMDRAKNMLPRCAGHALWLNYTEAIKSRASTSALTCKLANKPKGNKTETSSPR